MLIAMAITVVYLFRSRDQLQAKYTADLIQATSALQELTAEYLKQAFADSAAWQDRFQSLDTHLQGLKEKADTGNLQIHELLETVLWLKDIHDKPDGKGGYLWWGGIAVADLREQVIKKLDDLIAQLNRLKE